MSERDVFGSTLKRGTNLDVLGKARKFFQAQYGISLVSYTYTRDCGVRPKKFVSPDSMRKCQVCGRQLYKFNRCGRHLYKFNRTEFLPGDEKTLMVQQKQYIRFTDTMGKHWYACYKLNQCYKAVNFDATWSGTDGPFKAPQFEDFLETSAPLPPEVGEEIRATYDRVVFPFLLEWGSREITKSNVMHFISELREAERVWLVYFSQDPATRSKASRSLLSHIGVRHER